MRSNWFLLAPMALCACLELSLPEKTNLGPGSLRATVLASRPGRASVAPAAGARMRLVGSTLEAVADADGNVTLSGLTVSTGRVLVEFEGDGTREAKRARVISLEAVRAGFGKDVNLGQLVLGSTATVTGSVRRADVSGPSGHGGITVFAPQLRPLTFTGDDGAFVLEGLPEGELSVAASAPGYDNVEVAVTLGSAEEKRLTPLTLRRTPAGAEATLTGQVRTVDGPLGQVTVRVLRGMSEVSTSTGADGVFTFSGQPVGLTLLALEKAGFAPLLVSNVAVDAPVTTIGPFFLSAGSGSIGPLVLPSSDAGGQDAGNTADAGSTDAGTPDAGSTDAGSTDAGSTDAGNIADGGNLDAGNTDAGTIDAGPPPPFAIAGAPQIVPPGSLVTLDGTASTGTQPLLYTWTALPPNAGVMVTPNGTLGAHSAQFTAPAIGNVIEFSLTVTDRFGLTSTNQAITRVSVSRIPVARFGPDAGSYLGGDSIQLVSSSFDDGGLLLTGYSWAQVPAVPGATLVADGGRALLSFPAVTSATLVGVELTVTNVLGATSPPARQTYVALPAGTGANWTLTALLEGPNPILYTGANPPARIVPTVTTNLSSPAYSLAWQCSSIVTTQQTTDAGVLEFVVPRVTGPDVIASCLVTATGASPLSPPVLTATAAFAVRDDENPAVITSRPSFATARASPFGLFLRATEPSSSSTILSSCSTLTVERTGGASIAFSTALLTPQLCQPWNINLIDTAPIQNSLPGVALAPAYSTAPRWEGPFVTSGSYDDPRPVVVSAGLFPFDTLALSNPPMNPPTPYALVARDGTNLIQLSLDVLAPPSPCTPDCVLAASATPLAGLPAENGAPQGVRSTSSSTHLLVAMYEGDGGVVYARRSPTGAWSTLAIQGELFNAANQLRRVLIVDGGVVSDVYDAMNNTFASAEFVTTLPADGGSASPGESRFSARTTLVTVYRNGSFTMFQRDPVAGAWDAGSNFNAVPVPGLLSYRPAEDTNIFSWTTVAARTVPPHIAAFERTGGIRAINSFGPPAGFDLVQRGTIHVVAVSQNGDLRLYADALTGAMAPVIGPPRAVPLAPGDNRFDLDVACEAAWPRLALIEDALVVVWQERCAPSTTWRIAARVIH